MASELAERRGIALAEARALLAAVDLTAPMPPAERAAAHEPDGRRRVRPARAQRPPRNEPTPSRSADAH